MISGPLAYCSVCGRDGATPSDLGKLKVEVISLGAKLQRTKAEALDALKRWGEHQLSCEFGQGNKACVCGLNKAMRGLGG